MPRRRRTYVALSLFPCVTCGEQMQTCRCPSGFRAAEAGRYERDEQLVYEALLKEGAETR